MQRYFSTINDVYAAYVDKCGDQEPLWSRDELQQWLHDNGYTRYEDIDNDILDAAYDASFVDNGMEAPR